MKIHTVLCLAVVVAVVAACKPPVTPVDGDECERAYGHLGAVGCEPSKPESGTWVDVCRNGRRNGLFALSCINRAATFDAADQCGVNCSPK